MLLVTTPTGHTGRRVLEAVLAAGAPARVLVRDPARLLPEARHRCEIVRGDLRDAGDLGRALAGATAAFFCVPQSPDPEDVSAHFCGFAEPCGPCGPCGRPAAGGHHLRRRRGG